MADTQNGQEEDWEYASEDGEDYSWEYETEDEEPAKKEPAKKEPETKEAPEDRLARVLDEYDEKETVTKSKKIEEPEEEYSEDDEEEEIEDKKPANGRMDRADRNAIMEQMKRLQEGYNEDIDVGDSDYSLSESEEEDRKPPKKKSVPEKKEEDELDLSDLELLDPFGSEPVPVVNKKEHKTNGHSKDDRDDDKKHRRHRRKSKHSDKIEKFRHLESKDTDDKEDENKLKKIHVRSKDPRKIAKQFEKHEKGSSRGKGPSNRDATRKEAPKPPAQNINKICKVCGKEPYLVERIVAEKSWWCKNCFRCKECNKLLNLDTYASHQGVIYCKPHHKDLFKPKAVINDPIDDLKRMKELDFSVYNEKGGENVVERHKKQERRMETIVRENKPVELKGVVKSKVDDAKWDGLDQLDVGSKFMMFEKAAEEKESKMSSDRYGIMEKLKRLQEGEDVTELLAEIDDEMPSDEEEDEDPDDEGLTQVQKKAHHAEKLFNEDEKKKKRDDQRKAEIKKLRDKLMAGHRDSAIDSFDELNHRKVVKTKVDVRSENAKKFMSMFDKGEVPEGMNAGDRTTLEKDMELEMMRSKKREERDFFKKMEKGGPQEEGPKEPKLLIGKLKASNGNGEVGNGDPECETLSKKFSFFENYNEDQDKKTENGKDEKVAAVKDCKASAVINKFKDMERRVANGEDPDDGVRRPTLKRFTPPRKLGEESGSEYSDSEYSDSDYSDSEYYSSDSFSGKEEQEDEYLKNVREAARAKQLRAKFEEWEAGLGEDGGYTNLVDENGLPLETASKLKNRFEQLAVEEPSPERQPRRQVRRFKPKEAYEYQED